MNALRATEPPADRSGVDSLGSIVPLTPPFEDFDQAYDRLVDVAHRVAYRVLGIAADAEDVAAETIARASLRWKRLQPPADAWVATVAARLAIDRQRKAWRNLPLPDENATGDSRSHRVDDSTATLAAHLDLMQAMAALPKRQREVVSLRYLSEYRESEIAVLLGCSASSVQTHTRRGLATLRARLTTIELPDGFPREVAEVISLDDVRHERNKETEQ